MTFKDEFKTPNKEGNSLSEKPPSISQRLLRVWQSISHAGLAEITFRLGTHTLLIALILLMAWGLQQFYLLARSNGAYLGNNPNQSNPWDRFNISDQAITQSDAEESNGRSSSLAVIPYSDLPVDMPEFWQGNVNETGDEFDGIPRFAQIHTDVPSRPREEVITYTVKLGDTLFGIAKQYGLKPETILWANQTTLADNPHNLKPGQQLSILPVDGAYHRWSTGDGLNGVAKFFGVNPKDIKA